MHFILSAILMSSGLELIWDIRNLRKTNVVFDIRTELEHAVSIKRRSRQFREAARIIKTW